MFDASASNRISLPDGDMSSQQTFSLGVEQLMATDNNKDVTRAIEQMSVTKSSSEIVELLSQHISRENENFRKIISENATKLNHMIQLFNDGFNVDVPVSIDGRHLLANGDRFKVGMDKDLLTKVNSVHAEDSSDSSSHNKIVEERLDALERKLDSIYEHIRVSTKKSSQDTLYLDKNADKRLAIIERKLEHVSEAVGRVQRNCKHESLSETNHYSIQSIKELLNNATNTQEPLSANNTNTRSRRQYSSDIPVIVKNTQTLLQETSKLQTSIHGLHGSILPSSEIIYIIE